MCQLFSGRVSSLLNSVPAYRITDELLNMVSSVYLYSAKVPDLTLFQTPIQLKALLIVHYSTSDRDNINQTAKIAMTLKN